MAPPLIDIALLPDKTMVEGRKYPEFLSLADLLPDAEVALQLEPEELAGFLMEYLNALPRDFQKMLQRNNFIMSHAVKGYPHDESRELARALMEAWIWLEREGMLAPSPHTKHDFYFITRRGRQMRLHTDLELYRTASRLPRGLMHPLIVQRVWNAVLRGDYDIAIFQAFREVEIAVREASGLPATEIGVSLMRKAFDVKLGPLTDGSSPEAEREALSHLFAGAIGSYKNPASHRYFEVSDPASAVEILLLASHLMRIVDSRRSKDDSVDSEGESLELTGSAS